MTTIRRRFLLGCALLIAIACSDDATGPGESPDGQIAVGQTVLVRFDTVQSVTALTFQAVAESAYAIELAPQSGGVAVFVMDSVTEARVFPSDVSVVPSTPAPERVTPVFIAPTSGPYRIVVYMWTLPQSGQAEVTLRRSASGPETIPAAFTIGDSVAGEALGSPLDVDRFSFTGVAGTYVQPLLHLPGSKSADQAACLRIISPAGVPVGATIGFRGDTLPFDWPHSRTYLPASGTYHVVVGNGWNGCPSRFPRFYEGPYSFRLALIDTTPESSPMTIAIGDSVVGEAIEQVGDIDRFTITGTPHALFEVLARRVGGTGGTLRLAIGPTKSYLLDAGDTLFTTTPTGRVALPDSGKYTVKVTGDDDGPGGDTGGYLLEVHPIDTLPESHAATIVLGDSLVDEAIDPDGDIDRFSFTAAAGSFATFEFRTPLGPFGDPVALQVLAPDGSTVWGPVNHPVAWDTTLLRSGRVALLTSGTYALRVRSEYDGQGPMHRPYAVWSRPIDPAPETRSDTFAFGDTLSGESLDEPGDLDRFYVHVTQPTGATFTFHVDSAAVGPATAAARLVDSANGEVVVSVIASRGGTAATAAAYGLAPGSYYVEVSDNGGNEASVVGHYSVTTTGFLLDPEIAPDTVMLGDTVATETIFPTGDIDRFTFLGVNHQSVLVSFAGTGTPGDSLKLMFYPAHQPSILDLYAGSGGGTLSDVTSMRLDLPQSGPYEFDIRGATTGPYAFSIVPFPTTPEAVGDTFALGDTVAGEAIDSPGDLDRFTVTGPPGGYASIAFTAAPGLGSVSIVAFDPVGDTGVVALGGPGTALHTPRFRFPAGGTLEVSVAERAESGNRGCHNADCHQVYKYTGAYSFVVTPIDSAPETASATIIANDTVTTELIDPIGDLDQFTYAGTAGDTLVVEMATGPIHGGDFGLVGQIIDAADGASIASLYACFCGGLGAGTTGPFVLPHTGTYYIRIGGYLSDADHGEYWLLLRH